MHKVISVVVSCVIATVTVTDSVLAQDPMELESLLGRIRAYVLDYETKLTRVVAEEHVRTVG